MDSALSPRDIQARIRAGESVDDVARAAGVPVERIDAFAAPVIAEREHVAGLAQANPVRRRGESSSNRLLRTAIAEQLHASGMDPDDLMWDARLIGARRWQVTVSYVADSEPHEAEFVYDLTGRFSTAANDDARWMIGDLPSSARPGRPGAANDTDDELALVRAVSEPATVPDDAESDDAYTDTELTEVDGVYDIVRPDADMDALYDMLASFDEDSVRIYTGLIHPVSAREDAPSAETPDLPEGARVEPLYVPEDHSARRAPFDLDLPPMPEGEPTLRPVPEAVDDETAEPPTQPLTEELAAEGAAGEPLDDVARVSGRLEQPATESGEAADEPTVTLPRPGASRHVPAPDAPITEPEQPSLVDDLVDPSAGRRPAARKSKRASVPSWDEIMFGAPRKGSDPR